MAHQKANGQYMTPPAIVSIILDEIGYKGKATLYKTILEPSFGEGVFLVEIIKRIVEAGENKGFSKEEIYRAIRNNVYGIEKDQVLYQKAIQALNEEIAGYGIKEINWQANLLCADTLTAYKQFEGRMDFVAGNPPYIRIHNISEEYRNALREFRFAKGTTDLYVVFYEIGLMMLNETGKLGYISPNSFLRNASQKTFRTFLLHEALLKSLYDFKSSKIFDDADTYTCICILDKDKDRKDTDILYREMNGRACVKEEKISTEEFKKEYSNVPWNICTKEDRDFLKENRKLPVRIKDIAVIQNGISTNLDSVYIIKAYTDKECSKEYFGKHTEGNGTVFFKDKGGKVTAIESEFLRRCVKASRYEGRQDNTYILFPYRQAEKNGQESTENSGNIRPLTEEELQRKYPNAYRYLLSRKEELIKRDLEKNADWFLFARSQGLINSAYPKIVFKHIINRSNPSTVPYILDEDVIVYSGMYTTIKQKGNKETDRQLLQVMQSVYASKEFARYCVLNGKDMAGGYTSTGTKPISEFGIEEKFLKQSK